jgi:UDP-glucose 4-epimerase
MPYLAQVAAGRLPELQVFGDDYPTIDGTGVRDYIHVMDVVEGHRLSLTTTDRPGYRCYNLGTGQGTSVLELLHAFEDVSGRDLAYRVVGRRPGDVAELVASPDLAAKELGWQSKRDLRSMCEDTWRFQTQNPGGYEFSEL